MKTLSFFILSLFISTISMASQKGKSYCMHLEVLSHKTTSVIAHAACSIAQSLDPADRFSAWRCWFNDADEPELIQDEADSVGYNIEHGEDEAIYYLRPSEKIGQFLFEGMGINDALEMNTLHLIFPEKGPKNISGRMIFKSKSGDLYELTLKDLLYCHF